MSRRNGKVAHVGPTATGIGPANGHDLHNIEFQLIESLPVGMALIELCTPSDSRTWRLRTANAIAMQAIGDSLLDFLVSRLATFPFRNNIEEIYEQILHSRRPKGLRWIVLNIGAIRRTYSVTAFSVPPRHIGVLMQDESVHAETRRALTEEKNIHAEVSRAIESFLWRGDPTTLATLWVSREAQEILGYWPEHWINIPNFWVDHIHAADREKVARLVKECNSEEQRFDYRIQAANGGEKWLHTVIRRIETQNGTAELAGVMVDITGRKSAEEQAHDLSGQLLRSQDDERRRFARELHDSLGQYLSLLGMNVGRLSRTVQGLTEEERGIFGETTDLVEICCREVRTLSYLMHPPMLDEVGLGPALDWYVKGFSERSGIEVAIEAGEELKKLPKRLETALFRVAQEGLTNIYKHSGSRRATVRLRSEREGLVFEVVDYGKGIETGGRGNKRDAENEEAKGLGIRGMRERMRELGGTLEVLSGAGGTTLRVLIPRKAKALVPDHNHIAEDVEPAAVGIPNGE